jgi:hypothetical protein
VIGRDTIEIDIEGRSYRVGYMGTDLPAPEESPSPIATLANRQLVEGQTVRLGNARVATYRCEMRPPLLVLEPDVLVWVRTCCGIMTSTDLYW